MNVLTIGIASDHAGYACKKTVKAFLQERGIRTEDYGTDSEASCDYPDFAHPLAQAIEEGRHILGIAICGSGNGICMSINKHPGLRAALAWKKEVAALARQHNDANVLCLPARFISDEEAREIVSAFLDAGFEGGRHQVRVNKIDVPA